MSEYSQEIDTIHNWLSNYIFQNFKAHEDIIDTLCSIPGSDQVHYLASASRDHTVKIWNIKADVELIETCYGFKHPVRSLCSIPGPDKSSYLAVLDHHTIKILNPFDGTLIQKIKNESTLWELCKIPKPDGSCLFVTTSQNENRRENIIVFDPSSNVPSHKLYSDEHDWIMCLCAVPSFDNLPLLATGSYHHEKIKIWNLETGAVYNKEINGYVSSLCSIIGHNNSHYLIVGLLNGTIQIWNHRSGELICTLKGHKGRIHSLCPIAGPNRTPCFASCSYDDKSIKIWDPSNGTLLYSLCGPSNYSIISLCSIPGPNETFYLATSSYSGTINIWNLKRLYGLTKEYNSLRLDQLYLLRNIMEKTDKNQRLNLIKKKSNHRWNVYLTLPPTIKDIITPFCILPK